MRTNALSVLIVVSALASSALEVRAGDVKYRIRVAVGENGTRHRVLFSVRGESGAEFTKWTRLRGKHDDEKASDFSYKLPDVGPIDRLKLKVDYRGPKLDDWTPAVIEIWYPSKRRGGKPGTRSRFTVKTAVTGEESEIAAEGITNRPALADAAVPPPKRNNKKNKKQLDPANAAMKRTAPHRYWAAFETSKGPFVMEVCRGWAPHGADRFYNLVRNGFFSDVRFFRVVPAFMAQFGLHGDPKITARFLEAKIPDDPVKQSNKRGMVSFATSGPDSRTTQVFINYRDNARLDPMGFAPFGRVIWGMKVIDAFYKGYGDGPPSGRGPEQMRIQQEGNAYLTASFPKLDSIKSAVILREKPALPAPAPR